MLRMPCIAALFLMMHTTVFFAADALTNATSDDRKCGQNAYVPGPQTIETLNWINATFKKNPDFIDAAVHQIRRQLRQNPEIEAAFAPKFLEEYFKLNTKREQKNNYANLRVHEHVDFVRSIESSLLKHLEQNSHSAFNPTHLLNLYTRPVAVQPHPKVMQALSQIIAAKHYTSRDTLVRDLASLAKIGFVADEAFAKAVLKDKHVVPSPFIYKNLEMAYLLECLNIDSSDLFETPDQGWLGMKNMVRNATEFLHANRHTEMSFQAVVHLKLFLEVLSSKAIDSIATDLIENSLVERLEDIWELHPNEFEVPNKPVTTQTIADIQTRWPKRFVPATIYLNRPALELVGHDLIVLILDGEETSFSAQQGYHPVHNGNTQFLATIAAKSGKFIQPIYTNVDPALNSGIIEQAIAAAEATKAASATQQPITTLRKEAQRPGQTPNYTYRYTGPYLGLIEAE